MTGNNQTIKGKASGSIGITGKATARVLSPLPAGHVCYSLAGQISGEIARIELLLDSCIWKLQGVDPDIGSCLTGQYIGMHPRYSALYQLAIAKSIPDKMKKEIDKQSGRSFELAAARARAVHDCWWLDESTNATYQSRTKNKKNTDFGPKVSSEQELRKILDSVGSLSKSVSNFYREVKQL